MAEFVRALGIDYGTARIGVAASDEIGFLAHPVETVAAADEAGAIERIVALSGERKIEDLVIGLPLHMNGEEGKAVEKVRAFGEKLRAALPPGIRWHEVDERHTTSDAMAKLHDAGRTEKNSRAIIDQAAAVEILQRWLDDRAGVEFFPEDLPGGD